jgi:hypothetical protein
LEALVIIFQNKNHPYLLFYPSALLAVAVFAVIGLGIFQWLTNKAEKAREESKDQTRETGRKAPALFLARRKSA